MTKAQKQKILKEFKEEGIVVNGCLIKGDTIYTVVSKSPKSAPDVYTKQLDSEKERLPYVSNVKCFGNSGGLVDNGFHPNSAVFDAMRIKDQEERKELSEKYVTIFLEPLQNMISVEDYERFKDPRAYDIFEGEIYSDLAFCDVRERRQFNTAYPKDRYHMYLAAVSGGIVEKGSRSKEELKNGQTDEIMSNAQYAYESQTKVKTFQEKNTINKLKASAYFTNLLDEDKETLVQFMNYHFSKTNKLVNSTMDEEKLFIIFDSAIQKHRDSKARNRKFVTEYKKLKENGPVVKKELEVYNTIMNNQKVTFNDNGEVEVSGKTFANAKLAANAISKDVELYKELNKIVKE